jgi:hypothetical protein
VVSQTSIFLSTVFFGITFIGLNSTKSTDRFVIQKAQSIPRVFQEDFDSLMVYQEAPVLLNNEIPERFILKVSLMY